MRIIKRNGHKTQNTNDWFTCLKQNVQFIMCIIIHVWTGLEWSGGYDRMVVVMYSYWHDVLFAYCYIIYKRVVNVPIACLTFNTAQKN